MVSSMATSQRERAEGARTIMRSISFVAFLAMAAGLFEIVRMIYRDEFTPSHFLMTLGLVSILSAYILASKLGWIRETVGTIAGLFFFVNLSLNFYFAHALFWLNMPAVVTGNMAWLIALMIVPFLTLERHQARLLALMLGALISAQFTFYCWVHSIAPFDPFFGAEVIPFLFALAASYVLLDGFAIFREAAIKFHARAEALQETSDLMAKAAADAERARDEAEKSIALREVFLATMSHELRTPLNAIIGFSDAMKSGVLEKRGIDHYRTYAEDIHQSGEHVLGLINQMLEYSRVKSGTYDLRKDEICLEEVADQVLRMLGHAAATRSVTLARKWDQGKQTIVIADRHALVQIGLNLTMNAIKFSPKGASITLSVGEDGKGAAMLSVNDSGPGIPADRMQDVLQPFVRIGDASLASETGTGLGLAIVSNLAREMGARFELESRIGEGTKASLILPLCRSAGAEPERLFKHPDALSGAESI